MKTVLRAVLRDAASCHDLRPRRGAFHRHVLKAYLPTAGWDDYIWLPTPTATALTMRS